MVGMKEYSDRKKLVINLFATMSSFMVSAAISFFLSPYIVRTLGVEANGYVQLASNIVSYISVITVALNSMSGRFITIALAKGETGKAVSYYTSVFWVNIGLFIVLLFPFVVTVWKLDNIINISPVLVYDVKSLFALAFINFAFSNIFSLWNNAYYATNMLFLQYTRTMIVTFIRAAFILLLFTFLSPKVFYMMLASVMVIPINAVWNLHDKNRLLPELRLDNKSFSFTNLKEIFLSGIWRSLQSMGELLLTGLDLLICNIFINPMAMGVLALSKTMPTMIQQWNWSIASAFAPKLTINYAQGQKDVIWIDLKRSFKIVAVIGTLPLGGLIVYGKEFFGLWVPGEDATTLQILSILACFWMAVISGIQPVGNIFATVNKVKSQAVSVLISGILNTVIVLIALKFTELGIYAVAGTSVLIGLVRNLCYTIPASARYLGFQWYKFYIGVLYSCISTVIVIVVGYSVRYFIYPTSWRLMFISCGITGISAFIINTMVIFSRQERQVIYTLMKKIFERHVGKKGDF